MICSNCGQENQPSSKFCSKCGSHLVEQVQEVEEQKPEQEQVDTPEAISDESLEIAATNSEQPLVNELQTIELVEKELPFVTEVEQEPVSEELTGLLKKWRIGLGSVAAVLVGALLFFTLWESENRVRTIQEVNGEAAKELALEAIYLQNDAMTIYPNRMQHVPYYVYPESANTTKLIWESSNPNIKVNAAGYVQSSQENVSGELTLRNEDGSIKATTQIDVGEQEDSFYSTLDYINNEMASGESILDYNKISFLVGTDHDLSKLEKAVIDPLTAVEEDIDQYTVVQKQFKNRATNNLVDVDVYSEPQTNDIRKIVAIEYLENQQLKITDFYYTDGELFFYFDRVENYYRPVAARQDFEGVRAYFYNDALIRYRDIVKVGNGFEKTDFTMNDGKIDWKIYEYQNIDKDDVNKEKSNYKKAFDQEEETMARQQQYVEDEQTIVNAANNIYLAVVEQPDLMKVAGFIAYPDNSSASNVPVKIFSEKFKLLMGETRTDANGYYEFTIPMNQGLYRIYTQSDQYTDTTIYNIDSAQAISNAIQETMYLFPLYSDQYAVYLNLVDAISGTTLRDQLYDGYSSYDLPIPSTYVQIYIRRGINNRDGAVEYSREVDLQDMYELEMMLPPGNYTVEVVVNGYERNYLTLSTVENGMRIQSNIVPKIQGDEVRIVLTWSHTPSDLDSHLFLPNGGHISYYNREVSNNFLDVDMTSGYGPETITINNLSNGTYKYYVADFSNLSSNAYSSTQMSNSFARVDVYQQSGVTSFTVPRNQQSVIWQVLNISNGQIVPVQRMYQNVEDYDWWAAGKY